MAPHKVSILAEGTSDVPVLSMPKHFPTRVISDQLVRVPARFVAMSDEHTSFFIESYFLRSYQRHAGLERKEIGTGGGQEVKSWLRRQSCVGRRGVDVQGATVRKRSRAMSRGQLPRKLLHRGISDPRIYVFAEWILSVALFSS